jgi:hypothetical protein
LDPKLGPQIDQKMMAPTVVQQPVVQQPVAQQPPKTEDKGGIFPPKKK